MSLYRISTLIFGCVAALLALGYWIDHRPAPAPTLLAMGKIELHIADGASADVAFGALEEVETALQVGFANEALARRTLQVLGDVGVATPTQLGALPIADQNFWLTPGETMEEGILALVAGLSVKPVAATNLMEVNLRANRQAEVVDVLLTYTQLYIATFNEAVMSRSESDAALSAQLMQVGQQIEQAKAEMQASAEQKTSVQAPALAANKQLAQVQKAERELLARMANKPSLAGLQKQLQARAAEVVALEQQLASMGKGSAMALLAIEEIRLAKQALRETQQRFDAASRNQAADQAALKALRAEAKVAAEQATKRSAPIQAVENTRDSAAASKAAIQAKLQALQRQQARLMQDYNRLQTSSDGLFELRWQQKPSMVALPVGG